MVAIGPSSLRVEDTAPQSHSQRFSLFLCTLLTANAASSTFVVGVLFFKIFCSSFVLFVSHIVRFKFCLGDVHLVEKKSSDRSDSELGRFSY